MLYSAKLYLKDSWTSVPVGLALSADFFMWFYIIAKFFGSTERIFLHYNITFGVDLVGPWWKLLYIPGAGLAVILINTFLGGVFYRRNVFLARLVSVLTSAILVALLLATYLVVRLNS